MVFVGFAVVVLVVGIALLGWGTLANRLAGQPVRNRVVTACIGLAVIVFLGGVLNLLRIAHGWALDGLMLGGIALAAGLRNHIKRPLPGKSEWTSVVVLGLVIAIIMAVTIATQLPPRAYNYHDDFEKYFAFPVRMLQTGTLFGSPLSAIGLETLGGQAVLQAIIINHIPIPYINGVDAVFGLLLCLLLPASVVPRRTVFLPVSVAAVLLVIFINPQYVNISSLYIASAFIMTTILLLSRSDDQAGDENGDLPPPVLAGLLYAAIMTLKSSLPVFPAFQGALFCVAMALTGVPVGRAAKWGVSTVAFTLLFLSPWVLLHLPHYLHRSEVPLLNEIPASYKGDLDLFSFTPLFYGGSFALYTFLAIATGLSAVVIIFGVFKARAAGGSNASAIIASGTATVVSYLFFIMLGPRLVGYDVNLRYTIPFLIAGASTIVTLTILRVVSEITVRFNYFIAVILVVFELLILVGFSESLLNRMQQAFQGGNILSFSGLATSKKYLAYNDEVLHGDAGPRTAAVQNLVPAGQPIIAWVTTPFYLDYRRNIIYDVDLSGIGSPWAFIPNDVEYFIVEYQGYGVFPAGKYYEFLQDPGRKQSAEMILSFLKTIQGYGKKGDILYDDGRMIVFKARREG